MLLVKSVAVERPLEISVLVRGRKKLLVLAPVIAFVEMTLEKLFPMVVESVEMESDPSK